MRNDAKRTLARLVLKVRRVRDSSWEGAAGRYRLTLNEAAGLVVNGGDFWPFVGADSLQAGPVEDARCGG